MANLVMDSNGSMAAAQLFWKIGPSVCPMAIHGPCTSQVDDMTVPTARHIFGSGSRWWLGSGSANARAARLKLGWS